VKNDNAFKSRKKEKKNGRKPVVMANFVESALSSLLFNGHMFLGCA